MIFTFVCTISGFVLGYFFNKISWRPEHEFFRSMDVKDIFISDNKLVTLFTFNDRNGQQQTCYKKLILCNTDSFKLGESIIAQNKEMQKRDEDIIEKIDKKSIELHKIIKTSHDIANENKKRMEKKEVND